MREIENKVRIKIGRYQADVFSNTMELNRHSESWGDLSKALLKQKMIMTSMLDVYALTYLQNKPKIFHESITHRYHLYLLPQVI